MKIAASVISTNYGVAADDGVISVYVYNQDGITQKKLGSEHCGIKTDYRGQIFIVTDGACALQALKMWLYYNNNYSHACDIKRDFYSLDSFYEITPRNGTEAYKLSAKVGVIFGCKDGLPFEINFLNE